MVSENHGSINNNSFSKRRNMWRCVKALSYIQREVGGSNHHRDTPFPFVPAT